MQHTTIRFGMGFFHIQFPVLSFLVLQKKTLHVKELICCDWCATNESKGVFLMKIWFYQIIQIISRILFTLCSNSKCVHFMKKIVYVHTCLSILHDWRP